MVADAAILALFFAVALLYSSVGHAGASGYLAVMTLAVGLQELADLVVVGARERSGDVAEQLAFEQ